MTYSREIQDIRLRLDQELARKQIIKEEKEKIEERLSSLNELSLSLKQARAILVEVGKLTQKKFATQIETIVTKAIQAVFDRPFEFKVRFEEKRNKSECILSIVEGDNEYIPKDDMGVGVIDIAGFVLRIVLWSLQKQKTRGTFIYDEPLKTIGHDELMYRAGEMIRQLVEKLGIQVIIITHEPELMELGDKAWVVTHDGKQSHVQLVEKNQ